MPKAQGEVFVLTIRANPNPDWPATKRLAGVLKRLLRAWEFTCVKCEQKTDEAHLEVESPPES